MNKAEKYNELLDKLNIDESYTKVKTRPKYDHVKENIPPLQDKNLQADLLMLPTTSEGYKYLLTVVDLWSDEIDVRPLKNKSSENVLKAMKSILKGKHINDAAKIRTDNGTEFKGEFHKYFYDNGILHSKSLPYRHKQTGSIENVNKLLGRFLNSYMSTNRTHEWTDINLPNLVKELNNIRKRPDENPYTYDYAGVKTLISKYNEGDIVIRRLDHPIDENNNPIKDSKFRTGDLRYDKFQPRKITKILYYPQNIRYMLEGLPQVSYTEDELLPFDEKDSKFNVKKIWNKTRRQGITYYKVWFEGYLKKQSEWIPAKQLIEDGFKDEIDAYNSSRI